MSIAYVGSHTHSTTFVATNLLRSIRQLISAAGLDPVNFVSCWSTWEDAVAHWLGQRGLAALILEIFDPGDTAGDLRGRFDFKLSYAYGGDGELWIDPDVVRFTVMKAGSHPALCRYRLVARTTPSATDPPSGNWFAATLRSTDGFTQHNSGTAVAGDSMAASLVYYRKVC